LSDGAESVPSAATGKLADGDDDFEFDAASFLRCSLATVRASPARHDKSDGRALAVEG